MRKDEDDISLRDFLGDGDVRKDDILTPEVWEQFKKDNLLMIKIVHRGPIEDEEGNQIDLGDFLGDGDMYEDEREDGVFSLKDWKAFDKKHRTLIGLVNRYSPEGEDANQEDLSNLFDEVTYCAESSGFDAWVQEIEMIEKNYSIERSIMYCYLQSVGVGKTKKFPDDLAKFYREKILQGLRRQRMATNWYFGVPGEPPQKKY